MLTKAYAMDFFGAVQSFYDNCPKLPSEIVELELRRLINTFKMLADEKPESTQHAYRGLIGLRKGLPFHEADRNEWLRSRLHRLLDARQKALEELAKN